MDALKIEQLQSLQSKDQAALLDTVDEIRRHGVNRYVSLPQLIVCGDQSSGKSSVLEAISGVQFPVNDGLCTRFTTEVILRRSIKRLATVKLIPSKDASPSHKDKLSLFEKSSINHAAIPDLISKAKTFMGLTGNSTFSRDILQLEVSGPELPHLTLVDLPGLIHHPNKEQSEADVQIPKELVQKYMSQARSIVLAIVTAKNDTSNQVVLNMAKAADPQGHRSMGIITKPDCLIKDSPNESNFFALASNKETYFKLDWHVLRNGDFNERKDSNFDRDAMEKDFFASTIWRNLPSHKRGVEALRTRLSHVLFQQIQKELPSLIKEIEAELAACKTTLDRLGMPRDTPSSRRQYLTGIAGRFLDLVRAANDGAYHDPFFRPTETGILGTDQLQKTRLRATVRKAEQKFLERMHQHGHSYVLVSERPTKRGIGSHNPTLSPVSEDIQKYIHENQFIREIRQLLNDSKGKELPGTFTPLLVGDLFIRQSKNWKLFALEFVEDVWDIVKQFLDDVLVHVADEHVREALLEEIIDPGMDKILTKLKDKVVELHSPYARGFPKTLNPRFVKELESRRIQEAEYPLFPSNAILGNADTEDADAHACRELLHLMQAYYTVALDVFVDNVSNLAVENCLMIALEHLLSPVIVSEMSDEDLQDIAFESSDICELRSQTLEKQSSLQKSFELCRRQARKLASNRLNDETRQEAQKKSRKMESLLTRATEGIAKVNIAPVTSAAIHTKSEASKNTTSQTKTQSQAALRASSAFAPGDQGVPKALSPSLVKTTGSSQDQMAPQTSRASVSPKPTLGGVRPLFGSLSDQDAPRKSSQYTFGDAPKTSRLSVFGPHSAATDQNVPKNPSPSLFGVGNSPGAGTGPDAAKASTSHAALGSSSQGVAESNVAKTGQATDDDSHSDTNSSEGSLFGGSTSKPSTFASKPAGDGLKSTSGPGSTAGLGPTGLPGTSPFNALIGKSGPGSNSTGSGFGGLGSAGVTASTRPFGDVPFLWKTSPSSDANKEGTVDFSYLKDIPHSGQFVPYRPSGAPDLGGYFYEIDPNSPSTWNVYHHISYAIPSSQSGDKTPCRHSAEEIRLRDYHLLNLPEESAYQLTGI